MQPQAEGRMFPEVLLSAQPEHNFYRPANPALPANFCLLTFICKSGLPLEKTYVTPMKRAVSNSH
jgi:hypothetical protein